MAERGEFNKNFEQKKRDFFVKLGLRAREWLKTHKELGKLWESKKSERWENVSEHCLVEAARGEAFSDLLGLSDITKQLIFASAIIHDFNKKDEILMTAKAGKTPESFDEAYEIARNKLAEAGIPENIIEVSDSVGHASVGNIEMILDKKEPDESDIAKLIMHYIDDYTIGSEWVGSFDGNKNDFDRRMDANESNIKYEKIAAAGFYKEQRRVGELTEKRLAELAAERTHQQVTPEILPELIDKMIKEKIEKMI